MEHVEFCLISSIVCLYFIDRYRGFVTEIHTYWRWPVTCTRPICVSGLRISPILANIPLKMTRKEHLWRTLTRTGAWRSTQVSRMTAASMSVKSALHRRSNSSYTSESLVRGHFSTIWLLCIGRNIHILCMHLKDLLKRNQRRILWNIFHSCIINRFSVIKC